MTTLPSLYFTPQCLCIHHAEKIWVPAGVAAFAHTWDLLATKLWSVGREMHFLFLFFFFLTAGI